ncbi:MAG: alpha/beta hydrolase-fold protein [Roseiflexaceae bacterium]
MPQRTRRVASPAPVYDERVQHLTLSSQALGIDKHLYVYTPPDLAPGERVPALYLLRGHEREWVNRQEDQSRGGTNVIDVYEQLRQAGRIGPMVLVFPGLSSDDNRIPGLIVNMRAPQLAGGAAGVGTGRVADYFFDELLPYVDAHFPTTGGRRGIAGFSLGGAMAVKAAAQRPDLFASAGAYDGTFLYAVDKGRKVRARDQVVQNPMFDPAYGAPRDMAFVADNNGPNLILRAGQAAMASVTWIIGYGPRSAEPWDANYYRGVHLLRCLRTHGLANALPQGALPKGNHTWRTADAFMEQTLPLHDRALRAK